MVSRFEPLLIDNARRCPKTRVEKGSMPNDPRTKREPPYEGADLLLNNMSLMK